MEQDLQVRMNDAEPVVSEPSIEEAQRDTTALNAEVSNPALDLIGSMGDKESVHAYLKELWTSAEEAKRDVQDELVESLRQRNGEYSSEILSKIMQMGGSDNYHGMTGEKCRALETMIRDVLLENDTLLYKLQKTPKPELNKSISETVLRQAANITQDLLMEIGPEAQKENVQRAVMAASKIQAKQKEDREITKTLEEMKKIIDDQLIEGRAMDALAAFISDFSTYSTAFMYGPLIQVRRKLVWENNEPKEISEPFFAIERLSPYEVFPEPGISNIQDGYVFIRKETHRKRIEILRNMVGYDTDAIEEALDSRDYSYVNPDEMNESDSSEIERKKLENRDDTSDTKNRKLYLNIFWGTLSGKQLKALKVKSPDKQNKFDDNKEYDICCHIVNDIVIKCELSPYPLGKKPIWSSGAYKIPGALWHDSLPKVLRPYQRTCNTCIRSLQDNIALSSKGFYEINLNKLAKDFEVDKIVPGMIIPTSYDYDNANTNQAVRQISIISNAGETMNVLNQELILADNASGVPRLAYGGNSNGTGAGRTASGMSMMMSSASKQVKQMIKNIDFDVIKNIIEMLYNMNVLYNDNFDSKGDISVLPLGSTEVVAKEADTTRALEFLRIVSNPVTLPLLGEDGYRNLITKISKGLSIGDGVVPDEDTIELQKIISQIQMLSGVIPQQDQQQNQVTSASQEKPTPEQQNGMPKGGMTI